MRQRTFCYHFSGSVKQVFPVEDLYIAELTGACGEGREFLTCKTIFQLRRRIVKLWMLIINFLDLGVVRGVREDGLQLSSTGQRRAQAFLNQYFPVGHDGADRVSFS